MLVRERSDVVASPRKGPDWPPKSPLEVLLSSPNGRRRHFQCRVERSPSPSANKLSARLSRRAKGPSEMPVMNDEEDDEEDDDDEETLQLKLQAIQTRLKLKKLKKALEQEATSSKTSPSSTSTLIQPCTVMEGQASGNGKTPSMQIPLSPPTKPRVFDLPKSPARVALGIDKGLRAENVSLKRPPQFPHPQSPSRRNTVRTKDTLVGAHSHPADVEVDTRIKSFSERIREQKAENKEQRQKAERTANARSRGFGIRSTDSLGSGYSISKGDGSSSLPGVLNTSAAATEPSVTMWMHTKPPKSALLQPPKRGEPDQESVSSRSTLEAFSGLHLSKRSLSHETLTRLLANKTLYCLPKLLKEVKSPHFDPPDIEGDIVVLAIIASKSSPRDHAKVRKGVTRRDADEDAKSNAQSKFMVLRLVDLKWELDLFLFDTAFEQFWKLTPGTLVAILNPGIMPPKRGMEDTGRFALKLSSSDDTILEIGTARDLGFCQSIKANGQECGSWINAKKTEYCEFHVNLKIEKMRATRMEINSMARFGRKSESDASKRSIRSRTTSKSEDTQGASRNNAQKYDFEARSHYYALPAAIAPSAIESLDNKHDVNAFDRGMSRDERDRKLRAERQKERDMAKKLASIGSNAGGEYMRLRGQETADETTSTRVSKMTTTGSRQEEYTAASLGLLGKRAVDVSLNAAKRKRGDVRNASNEPMGWGGALKRGLLLNPADAGPVEGPSQDFPRKKKARFLLQDKGLRTPGRDSLGTANEIQEAPSKPQDTAADEEDDDDLDIVP